MTFQEWKAKVDFYVSAKIGLNSDDLPDCPYYDWYEDGVHPKHAANRAIKMAWW